MSEACEAIDWSDWEEREIERRKDFKPGNPSYDKALTEGRVVWGALGAFEVLDFNRMEEPK